MSPGLAGSGSPRRSLVALVAAAPSPTSGSSEPDNRIVELHDRWNHDYDVVSIGAGGAVLRASIEPGSRASACGGVQSLFGKAHTVMAEGASRLMATSTATTTGRCTSATPCRGKFLNTADGSCTPKAPDRVWEWRLRRLFDRTKDGKISQRTSRARYRGCPRRDAPGTGADPASSRRSCPLQQEDKGDRRLRVPAQGVRRVTVPSCCSTATASPAPSVLAGERPVRPVRRARRGAGHRGIGKSFKVTSNSWEYTGDGHALALRAGRR